MKLNTLEIDITSFIYSLFLPPVDIREKRPNWNSDRDKRDQGRDLGINEFFKQNVSKCVQFIRYCY